MPQLANIDSDSSQEQTLTVYVNLIPSNPEAIFYMNVRDSTIIEIQEET